MVSLVQAIILSIIQGITEWFPVSSSGHLALMQYFFGFQDLPFDVFLHFASIFAIVIIFWKDIIEILRQKNWKYAGLIILAILPAFLFGVLLKDFIISSFNNLLFLGLFFIFSGIVIFSTKFSRVKKSNIGIIDSLFVGMMQVFALFPGISRSGMTISAGLFAGLKKQEVVKFSFLLAIPVILGASLAEAPQIFSQEISYWILLASFIVTFLVSLATIKVLLKIIKSDNFWMFGVYDVLVGAGVLIFNFI